MDSGLLWYDNDPATRIEDKICRAVRRYREKFGQAANLCVVHPDALDGQTPGGETLQLALADGSVKVVCARNALRHHFWVGVAAK
jgi:hypothetical protein